MPPSLGIGAEIEDPFSEQLLLTASGDHDAVDSQTAVCSGPVPTEDDEGLGGCTGWLSEEALSHLHLVHTLFLDPDINH